MCARLPETARERERKENKKNGKEFRKIRERFLRIESRNFLQIIFTSLCDSNKIKEKKKKKDTYKLFTNYFFHRETKDSSFSRPISNFSFRAMTLPPFLNFSRPNSFSVEISREIPSCSRRRRRRKVGEAPLQIIPSEEI